jgi:hypothetical protein
VTEYIQRNKEKHVNEILRSREAQQQAERKDFRGKILMSAVVALIAIGGVYLFYKNSKNEAANFNSTAESIAAESLYSPDQQISECFDVSKNEPRFLKGRLENKIFPGPPNFEDVQTGDTPEPAFILQLHKPICVRGDEWSLPGRRFQDVHLVADSIRSSNLHELVGRDVEVSLEEQYGAHTGHHRAPLVANVIAVRSARAEEISDDRASSDATMYAVRESSDSNTQAASAPTARAPIPSETEAQGPVEEFLRWRRHQFDLGSVYADPQDSRCSTSGGSAKIALGAEVGSALVGDLNGDGRDDAYIAPGTWLCDGGNAATPDSFLVMSTPSGYSVEDEQIIRARNRAGFDAARFTRLGRDADGSPVLVGMGYRYLDNDPRCCPSVKRAIKYDPQRDQLTAQ